MSFKQNPILKSVSTTYTTTVYDQSIECTSGTFTLTLMTAVNNPGRIFTIKNSGSGVITIATTSSQTIDGNASGTLTLAQYETLQVQSNGSNWVIL